MMKLSFFIWIEPTETKSESINLSPFQSFICQCAVMALSVVVRKSPLFSIVFFFFHFLYRLSHHVTFMEKPVNIEIDELIKDTANECLIFQFVNSQMGCKKELSLSLFIDDLRKEKFLKQFQLHTIFMYNIKRNILKTKVWANRIQFIGWLTRAKKEKKKKRSQIDKLNGLDLLNKTIKQIYHF